MVEHSTIGEGERGKRNRDVLYRNTQASLDSVRLYLLINHALYYNDDRKIAFTLSYMKKGSAAIWAEVRRQQGLATLLFGTFAQFQND